MESLLHLGYVTISYLPVENCLVQTWHSYCTAEDYISIQEKSIAFIEENECRTFICDCTNAAPLRSEGVKWTIDILTPRLKTIGISHIELVLPLSTCTHMTIEYLEREIGSFMRFHQTMEHALHAVRCLAVCPLSV